MSGNSPSYFAGSGSPSSEEDDAWLTNHLIAVNEDLQMIEQAIAHPRTPMCPAHAQEAVFIREQVDEIREQIRGGNLSADDCYEIDQRIYGLITLTTAITDVPIA